MNLEVLEITPLPRDLPLTLKVTEPPLTTREFKAYEFEP